MSLRCLIGHDYGDPLTERDREESGDEVVVTVREFKECSRCGHRQVISENKEVTSIEEPDEGTKEEREPEGVESDYEDVSADEDDGVILEEEPEPAEREHGEWPAEPQRDEPGSGEGSEWPEVEGEDEGYAAAPAEGGPAEDVEFGGGLNPESRPAPPGEDGAEGTVEADEEFTRGSSITSADPGPTPIQQQRAEEGDTEFVCPECGHTAPGHGSSLRPGDICPECRRGYLTEREDGE